MRATLPDYAQRRRRAWELASQKTPELDAIVCFDAHDIHYLTGVHEGIFWLVLSPGTPVGLSRHMLIEEVRLVAAGCDIMLPSREYTSPVDHEQVLVEALKLAGRRRVGIVPGELSAPVYRKLTAGLGAGPVEFIDVDGAVGTLRVSKDGYETGLIRRCVAIAEQALGELAAAGAGAWLGRSERELAGALEQRMRELGADRQAFPGTGLIVGSGPNSASAHHQCGERRIQSGDVVLVDWGAELDAYRSDMTRTFFIHSVPEWAQNAYPVVEQALQRSAAALRPGARSHEIDALARETVTGAGFNEFYYGVGHGIGLEIHESPWLKINGSDVMAPGMVTTIEPGIYLPGLGGIRIENDYLITATGSECLGSMTTALADMLLR